MATPTSALPMLLPYHFVVAFLWPRAVQFALPQHAICHGNAAIPLDNSNELRHYNMLQLLFYALCRDDQGDSWPHPLNEHFIRN